MNRRSYGQNCALARAADLIGERWTLLLIRDLLVAPRRFNELQDSLRGMGSNLLAKRLRDLEAGGLIERPEHGARRYALTARGRALEPAVLALIRWGLLHGPENRDGDHHRDDWDLLALKAAFQPERAAGIALTVRFVAASLNGWVRIAERQMTTGLGDRHGADVVIAGTVADLFLHGSDPRALLQHGKPADLERFVSAFALRP